MKPRFRFLISLSIVLVAFFAIATFSQADTRRAYRSRPELSGCLFYRAKRPNIPVFASPELTSEVLDHLTLGEEVCGIGELANFVILAWNKQPVIRNQDGFKEEQRAYAKVVDLWPPPQSNRQSGLIDFLRNWYSYQRSGGIPEDPLKEINPLKEDNSTPH